MSKWYHNGVASKSRKTIEAEADALALRSGIAHEARVTYEEYCEIVDYSDGPDAVARKANKHRFELLEGWHKQFPSDVEERGYFANDYRGVRFILHALDDPRWETVVCAASMHCGGTYDEQAMEQAIADHFEQQRR